MNKVKIGVFGAFRGSSMINYCVVANNAEVVAICDKFQGALDRHKEMHSDKNIAYYTDFDEFIKHDMDAVVLANYANEHAPYAIRCLEAGLHVYSEVLPCQNMKEAVELVEAVEASDRIYAYGENFCYMPAPYEMKRLYDLGKIGEFEYAECEYVSNLEYTWHSLTYGDRNHWRNTAYSTFYCTHSLGPVIHATGLRPVSVTGFEGCQNERNLRVGNQGGQFGIEMVTLENGGIVKSMHGGLYRGSDWYCMYGSKGRIESARTAARMDEYRRVYVNVDEYSGQYGKENEETYIPAFPLSEIAEQYGHGGGDFFAINNFIEKILGNEEADCIDVYEGLDMFLPGLFAYRSILAGGIPMEIPNLRLKEERDKWRNDTTCTDRKAAGDMYIPSFSGGELDIPDEVYELMKKRYKEEFEQNTGHVYASFNHNGKNSLDGVKKSSEDKK